VATKLAHTFGKFGALCSGHATLAGGDDLDGVKAKDTDVAVPAISYRVKPAIDAGIP
jgi:hypothetical protein